MSSGGRGFRVSEIPRSVRNMIQNIKETGCCHSEEEIYAMLKECRMDPNETVQKLLLQDTFHEVKRKKDRKKETVNNREGTDSRWMSGPFGRVGRGGRGSFPSRHSDVCRTRSSSAHEKMGSKPHGAGTDQPAQVSQSPFTPGHGGSLSNHLSSNDGRRSRQVTGPRRGPTKQWKPKASSSNNAPVSGASADSDQSAAVIAPETAALHIRDNISDSEEQSHISEEELDVSHISDNRDDNVIIPEHIQVAEAIKNVLCFGSFNAAGQVASDNNVVAPPEEEDSIGHLHSSTHDPETVPSTVQQPTEAVSANAYDQFDHSGGGNHVLLSTAGYAPANQSGIVLSNVPVTQQAVPLYHQPTMPQYSPNYMPYGHYYPPFYASPSPSHQYVGNDAFLQQAQASLYPDTATGATAGVNFGVPQFQRGSHVGHPTHMSTSGGYGMYGAPAAGHDAGGAGNSGANADRAGSQNRENNVYNAGQQAESSTVWIAASGRATSGLQATSFYNLSPQGQHVPFPLSQGHVSFASTYHPAQAATAAIVHPLLQHSQAMPGAVDMARSPPVGVYHQPRHATQMNWPNNF